MTAISRKSIHSVALPAEHGGWSFWLEPVLLAMLVAPSATGFAIVILSLASFLMRQPLKIALLDLRKKKLYLRTRIGIGFVALYGLIALLAFGASLAGGGLPVIAPLIPAYLVAIVQIWLFDIRGNSRHWLPEILGASIMSIFGVSIALAGGWTIINATSIAIIIIARAIPTIFYVRARLQQIKLGETNPQIALCFHGLAVIIIMGLAISDIIPWLTLLAILILGIRATYFLHQAKVIPAKVLGIQEVLFGLMLVGITAIGYWINM